jgi:hypothetical protein
VLHRARSRRRFLIRLAPCVALVSLLAAAPVAGGLAEEPGDVFLEVENDDLDADRFDVGDAAANDASYEPAMAPTSGSGEPATGARRFLPRLR